MTVYLNGKFLAQAMTGVQRVARCMLQALDTSPGLPGDGWVLLHPPGVQLPPLRSIQARPVGCPGLPLHLWEQVALPWAARRGLLISLAGSAPAMACRQFYQLHDAAIYDSPLTYTRCFVVWYRLLFSWLVWRKVHVFTVSEFSRNRLMHHLGIAESGITVLGNGADHLDAVPADCTVLTRLGVQNMPYLLAIASDSRGKNLARLLQAFGQLPATAACSLVLVGGRNPAVFRTTQATAAEPGTVLRAGQVSDAELKALYQHAQALVVPSLYEGFGLPVVEAMRLGCPVVASDAAALPEVCAGAALAFDPHDTQAIAAAMACVVRDDALRHQLRRAGLARTLSCTWQQAATGLQQAVRQAGYV